MQKISDYLFLFCFEVISLRVYFIFLAVLILKISKPLKKYQRFIYSKIYTMLYG